MTNYWIGISVPLYTGMVYWPDHPAVQIRKDGSKGILVKAIINEWLLT